ncbi:NAD-dependent epimerase/dehydratase family protein [Xylophilus rhododendri]|uniref:GDP-L-fucose synthase n=1 Tax=Xylophilus rhododendri TaxID=2697032 RepID=A0A857JBT6_9BURK|nr:GDP-L-fucose synthase [Xylophilus rhododendri]QHJ00166.1 NAD-dependent epimerase/dehydratase family protein [Xylophilus rhododendri]
MRILLTGGRGMVGRNFLEHASVAAHEVLAPTSAELDLTDAHSVHQWFARHKVDMVVHAAGRVGGIQANMREPVAFLLQNLDMGRNVVGAARQAGIKHLLNLSSSCMYPRYAESPLREDLVLQGELEPTNEGYALAKIITMRLCEYISREDPAFAYKTLIPCNIYGKYDKFDPVHSHMVPAIIHKLHQAKLAGRTSVDIWGDGNARREFMYAGDLARAMWSAVERFDSLPSVMNVGLGSDLSVNEYYAVAAAVVGYEGAFDHDLSKPVGMKRKTVDITTAQNWGWHAATTLETGLSLTYANYLEQTSP